MRAAIFLFFHLSLTACAFVPNVEEVLDDTPTQSTPQIEDARGPLSLQQSQALLDKITLEAGDEGALKRHLAIEEAIAESPLIAGNATKLLPDGEVTFRAMFTAIRNAKDNINLEYYIFENIESDGEHLSDVLIAKRQQGVSINIIYDSYGSSGTPADFFELLESSGINLVAFNPVNPFKARGEYAPNNRDHRKILIVDGRKAIVGGINLSTTYQSNSYGKSGGVDDKSELPWRDTDLEIYGPAVAELQKLFEEQWADQKGPPLENENFYPTVPAQGKEVVRIIGSSPEHEIPRYYVTLLSAIRNAEKNIWLSTAYFVPTDQEMEDLVSAAKRGIDVRLLLPGESDSSLAIAIGHSHYGDLLKAGVKIYEVQDLVLHSKAVTIDGVWSVIGSSNFDPRSVVYNEEVDALVLGSATAQEFQDMFERDFQKAHEIDLEIWQQRPIAPRIKELFSRVWRNLL